MSALLEVKNLKKYFPLKTSFVSSAKGTVKAVDDISFTINKGETYGLVGESGCGKSTTGRAILNLFKPTGGEVIYNGKDILKLSRKELLDLRTEMQIIFQDPYSSLNPRMSVRNLVGEAMLAHGMCSRKELDDKVMEIIKICGLAPYHIYRYPHQFSGGQRQRIGIARALALNPSFVVCDEPVSALDVSIQSQILNLMMDLQEKLNLSYLFISHDLSVVKHISHRVGVMYLGSLVEEADKQKLYDNPLHPYTRALLSAIPVPNPEYRGKTIYLQGELPSNVDLPSGCKFHTRCPHAKDVCKQEVPKLQKVEDGHKVACHFAGKI